MPKNTPEQTKTRRDDIATAAARCFSRNGFHATSMDDVITEAGLSAGAVYRYFPGKQALVEGAVRQAVPLLTSVFDELAAEEPPPPPARALHRIATGIAGQSERDGYDLVRLGVQAWGEALREPYVAALATDVYGGVRRQIESLAEHWREDGHVARDADPAEVAQAFFALLPGFILQRLLLGDVTPDSVTRGFAGLLGAPAPGSA